MVAIGHLVGYGAGSLDLPRMLGTWLGETQFKQLIIIAAFSIVFAMGLTSWAVTERVLISSR
jgi:solute carrier family 45 protein 1/2/4